jgi:broad specificity phosphatase PhoE
MPQTLWIARHGNRLDFVHPEWFNTTPLRYDPPLSEDGQIQAQQLAQRLQSEAIAHIFCSPFLRAIQTAHPIATALDLPLNLEAGLGEWHNPDWMTEFPKTHDFEFLQKIYPRLSSHYQSRILPQYPESQTQLCQRFAAIAHQLLNTYSENILLVGHGATAIWITAALVDNAPMVQAPLCSLMKLVREGDRWHPELLGDTTHLSKTETTIRLH